MNRHLQAETQALIEACRRGERAAQFKLYHQYAAAMLNTAFRIVNDEEEAKDVLQEAFLKVFRKIDTFSYRSTIGAWIKRIVINTAINHSKKRGLTMVDGLDEIENVAEAPAGPASDLLDLDVRTARSALRLLPDGYRTVLTLYLVEGYDHKEIAEILDIKVSTSLSQYNRGKKKLREIIQELNAHGSDRKVLRRP